MANIKLKKGQILFAEGEPSHSMYFIQKGTLRLFKKKSAGSSMELSTLHNGDVVGEMGFLDGGPRSASAEALHDTDLVEINNTNLQEQFKLLPQWLIVLLKTLVTRLRASNTKVKQLESASTQITYGKDGPMQTYVFLSIHDAMKISMSLLLAASKSSATSPGSEVRIKPAAINKYANQVMSIHINKITEMLSIFESVGIIRVERTPDPKGEKVEIVVLDPTTLDVFITFANEENLKENSKKFNFSTKGVHVLELINKYQTLFPANSNGISTINMAQISESEKQNGSGKAPFTQEDFNELVKNKVASEISIRDSNIMITQVSLATINKIYKMQKILKEIESVNQKKRQFAA